MKHEIMKRKRKTGFVESAVTVPCPRRIQRTMFRNLQRAARSNIDPQLAKRAAELLAMIEVQSKPATGSVHSGCVNANAPALNVANKAAMSVNVVSKPQWLGTALKQFISRVFIFVKRILFPCLAHTGYLPKNDG